MKYKGKTGYTIMEHKDLEPGTHEFCIQSFEIKGAMVLLKLVGTKKLLMLNPMAITRLKRAFGASPVHWLGEFITLRPYGWDKEERGKRVSVEGIVVHASTAEAA